MPNRTDYRAYTLIEVLVVVAIVLVISGIVMSVVLVGKDRAKLVVDISNLHQIGLAGAIYASDYDDRPALSTLPLLKSGYVDASLVAGPTDDTENGLAVSFRKSLGLPVGEYLAAAPKITYIGPGEGDWPLVAYETMIGDAENQGWLVDLTRGDDQGSGISMTEGKYRRLLFDSSVITRTMGAQLVDQGGYMARNIEFKRYFADFR